MTSIRKAFGAINFNDTLFVIGGLDDNGLSAKVEALIPAPSSVISMRKQKLVRVRRGKINSEVSFDSRYNAQGHLLADFWGNPK